MNVPFVGGSHESQSPDASAERTVNWYPEILDAASPTARAVLYPCPGVRLFARIPQDMVRGMVLVRTRLFVVGETGFYEVDSSGTVTLRGTVASDSNPAYLVTNGDNGGQVVVYSGGNAYLFVLATNAFSTVLTGDADIGGYLDGYFLALDTSTSKLRISNLNDGATWGALDVAQRNVASDPWVTMVVADRLIHLIGTRTSEAWYNNGDTFPFAHVQGSLTQDGAAAPYSTVALVDNTRIWLTANSEGQGSVKRASGFTAQRISTHAIEHIWRGYNTISDAVAWSYAESGHTFYVLNFPTQRATWVYDATTNLWHERGPWDTLLGRYEAGRGRCYCFAFDKNLVGDRLTGGIFEQRIDLSTDFSGAAFRRLRQGPHLYAENQWLEYPEVRVHADSGSIDPSIATPQLMLQWSDDGGHTWSAERWVEYGGIGQYGEPAAWRRCGRSRDRIFRVVSADPVPCRLLSMEVGSR
jgi:hypothetical protein